MRRISTPRSPAGRALPSARRRACPAQHQPPGLALGGRVEVGEDAAEVAVAGEVARSTPQACGAAATWASSGSAACGNRAASAAAGCGSNWPASCSWRPGYCPRRTAAGSARAAPSCAPAPAPRSRAAAADEAAGAQPLGLAAGDELVDDRLRAVGEVAELRFPQHQRARVGDRIAIFEAEHAEFGQRASRAPRSGRPRSSSAGYALPPVAWSTHTAWRWLKVPRPLSWPDRRTPKPS
jgi:hypothetical protein